MRYNNITMKTTIKRGDLLEKLRTNRELHAKIVQEAREGYVKSAKVALAHKMEELAAGKIAALTFSLRTPVDCTQVYDTTIKMLEMNVDDTVVLAADEFRNLVEDQWDWSREFYASNASYSRTAATISEGGME
jgi:hypothetical protein